MSPARHQTGSSDATRSIGTPTSYEQQQQHSQPLPSSGVVDDSMAALRGAAVAFTKHPLLPSSSQPSTSPSTTSGAQRTRDLLGEENSSAATRAASRAPIDRSTSPARSFLSLAGGDTLDRSSSSLVAARLRQWSALPNAVPTAVDTTTSARHSEVGGEPNDNRPGSGANDAAKALRRNPSFIAATIAASRSASPSPQGRRSPAKFGSMTGSRFARESVDSASIPPTGSLITMFEQGNSLAADVTTAEPEDPLKRTRSTRSPPVGKTGTPQHSGHQRGISSPGLKHDDVLALKPAQGSRRWNLTKDGSARTPQKPAQVVKSAITATVLPQASQKHVSGARGSDTAGTTAPNEAQRKPTPGPKPRLNIASKPRVISTSSAELLSPKPVRLVKPPPESIKAAPAPLPTGARSTSSSSSSASTASPPSSLNNGLVQRQPPSLRETQPVPLVPSGFSAAPRPASTSIRLSQTQPLSNNTRKALEPTPPKQAPISMTMLQRPKKSDSVPANDSPHHHPDSSLRSSEKPSPPPPSTRAKFPPSSSAPLSPVARSTFVASPPPLLPPGPRQPAQHATRASRLGKTSTSALALEPLTHAMVAGAIASQRVTPHNTGSTTDYKLHKDAPDLWMPPPSPPPRTQKSPKLLTTLRKPAAASVDDDDAAMGNGKTRGHRRKLPGAKHAHHEGSRKRWRDEVTPRERKRYEAVWASNKGLLLVPPSNANISDAQAGVLSGAGGVTTGWINGHGNDSVDRAPSAGAADAVVNLAVREIWNRSRLPEDELAEVWDLVDRGKKGMLDRREFVVGLWLIDQRLKGRKIPTKVSESVWGSVHGVKMAKPRYK